MEDAKRTDMLSKRMEADGFVRNPVIVGKIDKSHDRFLLIDGVNRVCALRNLGCKDVVAQITDYWDDSIEVDTWNHVITGFKSNDLVKRIGSIDGVKVKKTSRKSAEVLLRRKKIIACLLLRDNGVFIIENESDFETKTGKLVEIVDIYAATSEMLRVSIGELGFLFNEKKDFTAILVIPPYEKKDILRIALSNQKLPPGITRHTVPNRALGLNIDLSLLKADLSIKDKNDTVTELINERIVNKRTRFYPESVFVFDD